MRGQDDHPARSSSSWWFCVAPELNPRSSSLSDRRAGGSGQASLCGGLQRSGDRGSKWSSGRRRAWTEETPELSATIVRRSSLRCGVAGVFGAAAAASRPSAAQIGVARLARSRSPGDRASGGGARRSSCRPPTRRRRPRSPRRDAARTAPRSRSSLRSTQGLLTGTPPSVGDHERRVFVCPAARPRSTCTTIASAASEPAGASYSSWRLSHTLAGLCG